MSSSRDVRRRLTSSIMTSLCVLSVLIALVPVVLIFFFVVQQGIGSLDWNFFTKTPVPPGETGGGMANSIVGTLIVCGVAGLFGVPFGILSGSTSSNRRHTPRLGRALCGRHAERCAVDRHRPLRVRHLRAAGETLQRARRRLRAWHHDDSARRAHHRRAAASGAVVVA
jgi:hypothetical protein